MLLKVKAWGLCGGRTNGCSSTLARPGPNYQASCFLKLRLRGCVGVGPMAYSPFGPMMDLHVGPKVDALCGFIR